MATLIVCDGGCGAQSPDPKTGLHEANHWLTVRAWWPQHHVFGGPDRHRDKTFCKPCGAKVLAAIGDVR